MFNRPRKCRRAFRRPRFPLVLVPRHDPVKPGHYPPLERYKVFPRLVIDHRVRRNPALSHSVEPPPNPVPRLGLVVAAEHVRHQVLGRYAGSFEQINPLEENPFVFQVVPCRVKPPLLKLGVSVLNRCQCRRRFLVDQPDVDALAHANPKDGLAVSARCQPPIQAYRKSRCRASAVSWGAACRAKSRQSCSRCAACLLSSAPRRTCRPAGILAA